MGTQQPLGAKNGSILAAGVIGRRLAHERGAEIDYLLLL
jgi:hypothetical protein